MRDTKALPLIAAGIVLFLIIAAMVGSNNDTKTNAHDSSRSNTRSGVLPNAADPEDSNFGRGWPIDVEDLYNSVEVAPGGFSSPYAGKRVYVEGAFGGKVPGKNNWIFVRGSGGHSIVAIPDKKWVDLAKIDDLKLAIGEHVAELCGSISIDKEGASGAMVIYAEHCFLMLSEQQLKTKGILGSQTESAALRIPGTGAGGQHVAGETRSRPKQAMSTEHLIRSFQRRAPTEYQGTTQQHSQIAVWDSRYKQQAFRVAGTFGGWDKCCEIILRGSRDDRGTDWGQIRNYVVVDVGFEGQGGLHDAIKALEPTEGQPLTFDCKFAEASESYRGVEIWAEHCSLSETVSKP